MALYTEYDIIDPTTGEELREKVVQAIRDDSPLEVTARERLDQLSERRRTSQDEKFQLELLSIQLGRDGFLIARLVDSHRTARLDYTSTQLMLTVTGSPNESVTPTP